MVELDSETMSLYCIYRGRLYEVEGNCHFQYILTQ